MIKTIHRRGGNKMVITATELKNNLGRYLEMAADREIIILKNGKQIARLTSPKVNKIEILKSLVGTIPSDVEIDEDALRKERLSRQ